MATVSAREIDRNNTNNNNNMGLETAPSSVETESTSIVALPDTVKSITNSQTTTTTFVQPQPAVVMSLGTPPPEQSSGLLIETQATQIITTINNDSMVLESTPTTAVVDKSMIASSSSSHDTVVGGCGVPSTFPSNTTTATESDGSGRVTGEDVTNTTTTNTTDLPSPKNKKIPYPLRRGKWTTEEEHYANRLIHEFKSGLLPLTDGTTLRNYLSKLLNCDPMRISKKFVGNNCIGKQVFRRRVPDINRLTPEQMQKMCVEISDLERRFYDRVAQTNRVKSSGVTTTLTPGGGPGMIGPVTTNHATTINIMNMGGKVVEVEVDRKPPPMLPPPWLRPPRTYRPKEGKMLADYNTFVTTSVPLKQSQESSGPFRVNPMHSTDKPMEKSEISSTTNTIDDAAAATNSSNDGIPRTESALEQLARTASAAKFVEDIVNGEMTLEDESLGTSLSQSTLQGSFEALMSMDLQSVENLVELAATSNSSAILSELNKNYSESLKYNPNSSANLSTRMESFIKSLSNANLFKTGLDSQQALGCLLNASCSDFFDAEKFFKKGESSSAFPQLSGVDGLDNGSHNSVEDFLSLMASGDIPHQDPNMLQVPLQKIIQNSRIGSESSSKRKLSQHQLAVLASRLTPGGMTSTSKKRKKK